MMKILIYRQIFVLIGVLYSITVSQCSQNESSIAPSATSQTVMTSTASPSSASPIENNKDGDLDNNANTITRPSEFKGRFTITNRSWKSQYANVKSLEYTSLKTSLETVLNSALENKISGFVMCVVQWFNKGSVITDFVVYVKGNPGLSSEGVQRIMSEVFSSGPLGNFALDNVVMETEPTEETEPESDAPLMIELWLIITIGGSLIVILLLIIIIGILIRNRALKKALNRERRDNEERQQQLQRRQVETREALSIIAASSTGELSTFLQNDSQGQGGQRSRSYSMGTTRSVERLVELLRNSELQAAQGRRADTLISYDESMFQPLQEKQAEDIKKDQEKEDVRLNNKNKKSEFRSRSVSPSSENRSSHEDKLDHPASKDDVITQRNELHSKPKDASVKPSQEKTVLPAQGENKKDQPATNKTDEETTSPDRPENQVNEPKNKTILSQVQAFEKAADMSDEEREKDKKRQVAIKPPKKLKHISFDNALPIQPDMLEERRKRQEDIRPLGGVVRRLTVNPLHQHSTKENEDEK